MAVGTIVFLNDYCHVNGGASKVAIDEAVALARMGHKVIFLGAVGPVCDELRDAPLEIICLGQNELIDARGRPGVLLQGLWNRTAFHRMKAILSTLSPETTIVHLHGYTKALTTSPVRAAVEAGFKVICTLHDFFAACPNGAFFDYVERKPCLRTALSLDCVTANCDKRHYAHKVYRVARSLVQRGPGRLPDGVRHYITLSRGSAELLKLYLPKDAQYYPLDNIIEVARLPPVEAGSNTAIVAVGRLDVEKGIETLVEAARRAAVDLVLVGDGPLRGLAETYPRCRVTGWVSSREVVEALDEARCLVFPSIWYETYGLVVAEAAARGVPAIISDISAAAERVEDNVTGWLVRAGDVADLQRCLALTCDNEAVSAAGRAAYDRFWAKPPNARNHVTALSAIYETMLVQSGLAPKPHLG